MIEGDTRAEVEGRRAARGGGRGRSGTASRAVIKVIGVPPPDAMTQKVATVAGIFSGLNSALNCLGRIPMTANATSLQRSRPVLTGGADHHCAASSSGKPPTPVPKATSAASGNRARRLPQGSGGCGDDLARRLTS